MSSDLLQDELVASKIAVLMMTTPNISIPAIAKATGVGATTIRRILATGKHKELMETAAREQIAPIIAKGKADLVGLLPEAVRVFKELLAENNIEAAKQVVKIAIPDANEDKPADSNLTIIMPGQKEEKVIEVKSHE